MKLLSDKNHKIEKSNKSDKGYFTKVLHLAPHNLAKCGNVCPNSTKGCRSLCLNLSGHGVYPSVQKARIARTKLWFRDPNKFGLQLLNEIENAEIKAKKLSVQLAIRLNGTSDIDWENQLPEIFVLFPKVKFYDYTKVLNRVLENKFKNYHLTYSISEEDSNRLIKGVLSIKKNVAIVYRVSRSNKLPKRDLIIDSGGFRGFRIIDGDKDDLRFLDPKGVIIGLRMKGKARKDKSGFVKQV
jgi:hypothetical protein